jgi:hypothetical protein
MCPLENTAVKLEKISAETLKKITIFGIKDHVNL